MFSPCHILCCVFSNHPLKNVELLLHGSQALCKGNGKALRHFKQGHGVFWFMFLEAHFGVSVEKKC